MKLGHITRDNIPEYVRENYPLFVEYLRGYYEWLETYGPIKDLDQHLSRKTLKTSLDEYTSFLSNTLLNNIPENVFSNKELAIKWSKNINTTKGSKNSIKFLFKLLYGEDITIFLPKTNLFKLSAGNWASDESIVYVSPKHGTDLSNTNIGYIKQVYERSSITADVTRLQTIYSNKMILTELYVKKLDIDFELDKILYSQDNTELKILPTSKTISIINGGFGYSVGDRLYSDSFDEKFVTNYVVSELGLVSTDIYTFLSKSEIIVSLNNNVLNFNDYRYENGIVYSDLFEVGDDIEIKFPVSQGLFVVKGIDEFGSITSISTVSPAIGIINDFNLLLSDGYGQSGNILISSGSSRDIDGRYLDNVGMLSDSSFLHDSNYYQNYSYVIQTEQDINSYSDILFNTVHPSGMKFFGSITILSYVENLIDILNFEIESKVVQNIVHKYGLGPRLSFIDKFKEKLDIKFYPSGVFDSTILEPLFSDSEIDQTLIDLGLLAGIGGLNNKSKYCDTAIRIPDDYIEYDPYKGEYFETEYISNRIN